MSERKAEEQGGGRKIRAIAPMIVRPTMFGGSVADSHVSDVHSGLTVALGGSLDRGANGSGLWLTLLSR